MDDGDGVLGGFGACEENGGDGGGGVGVGVGVGVGEEND